MLNELDESRLMDFKTQEAIQKQCKDWYNHHLKDKRKAFEEGGLVLLYDSRYRCHPGKLKMRWTLQGSQSVSQWVNSA